MKIKVDNITYVVPLYIALFVYKNRILLKLKRVKRFIKRAIKEFGLGFLVTLFLFGIYLIIAVIVDPVINQTDKIYKTIWNCTPMLYTGIVIAFTTSVINHEKHRHRCLKKQWLFYSDISFTYTDYIVSILKIIKVKVTYDCLKNNENVEADYFESILELLTEFPDIENKVKEDVKNNLNEKRNLIIPNKPFFQKTVNEILDSSLDQFVYTLPSEQRDELLNKLREIKEKYYAEFKQIIPIQINQETGVRFNPIQIEDESIIASLAQQISTKSYTTSDIRKVVINKDDLALTLQKIKEMVEENEKLCIANNTSNSHIIKGRKLVKEFYEDWEKSKTNLLKSAVKQDVKEEENLISTVIKAENVKEKVASNKVTDKKKQVESSRSSSTTKGKSSGNKTKSSNPTKANNKVNKNQTNNEANKNQSKSSTNQTKTSNEFIGGTVGGFGGEKQEVDLLRKSIAVSERLRERRKASNKDVGGGLEL